MPTIVSRGGNAACMIQWDQYGLDTQFPVPGSRQAAAGLTLAGALGITPGGDRPPKADPDGPGWGRLTVDGLLG